MSRDAWAYNSRRPKLRLLVLARDRGVCHLCGLDGATTVDHVIPRALGGSDDLSNLRAAHAKCNQRKGAKPPKNPLPSRGY